MISIDFTDIIKMLNEEAVEEDMTDVVEDMMVDIFTELTAPPPTGTPVDTGQARNGWQIDLSDPKNPEIWNTVPYIGRLNDGSSKQSPAGFVEAAIDKFTR